jgi:hypothetical protein
LQGINIPLEEMWEIHDGQRQLHAGVDQYQSALVDEWNRRGGWVLSGLGFPTPVYEKKLKDCVNRVVQRTGHDVHVIQVWILHSMLEDAGIRSVGVVWDFHDQYIFQVSEEDGPRALEVAERAAEELNRWLGGDVRIKYGPRLTRSMSEAKMEEEWVARERELNSAGRP